MRIIVAGDYVPIYRTYKLIESGKYSQVFPDNIVSLIRKADYSILNLESPVVESGYKPIVKNGPNLGCPENSIDCIKYLGFKGVAMANNHIFDYGYEGVNKTIKTCLNHELDIVGSGLNLRDAEKILYVTIKGKKLAVINCCEHEFSIATEKRAGANPLNPIRQFYSIKEAKNKADYVLVIVHGGHEHFQLPTPRMVETYRFFIESGADAVVNHHQHCFSGYEMYKEKPIFYGLGNFCFDSANTEDKLPWNYGYLLELSFKDTITFSIYPYKQCGKEPKLELLDSYAFDKTLNKLNRIINNDEMLKSEVYSYYASTASYQSLMLEPYQGRILRKLYRLGFLPSFVKGRKTASILNMINCESHRDKLIYILEKYLSH